MKKIQLIATNLEVELIPQILFSDIDKQATNRQWNQRGRMCLKPNTTKPSCIRSVSVDAEQTARVYSIGAFKEELFKKKEEDIEINRIDNIKI